MVATLSIRPALMHRAETWALKKAKEKKLKVAEMRILRWMCRVTKLDKIRHERIRATTNVGEITKKVQERRLKWYSRTGTCNFFQVTGQIATMKWGRGPDNVTHVNEGYNKWGLFGAYMCDGNMPCAQPIFF